MSSSWEDGWAEDHARREAKVKALRHARITIPDDLRRGEEIRRTWKRVVGPLTSGWRETMEEAGKETPAMLKLRNELAQSRGSRPGRHWAGRLVQLRLWVLRGARIGLALGKILFVVALALGLIYLLLEWTSGLWY